ncbi:MAG: type II toxin-antitoxin system RelB/DinJ family antitoxin [Anaerovoracaceae bacterium]
MFCNELGLNMSTAVIIFAKAVVLRKEIPFDASLNIPNAETIKAIEDVNNGENLSKTFDSVEEMMSDLNA